MVVFFSSLELGPMSSVSGICVLVFAFNLYDDYSFLLMCFVQFLNNSFHLKRNPHNGVFYINVRIPLLTPVVVLLLFFSS